MTLGRIAKTVSLTGAALLSLAGALSAGTMIDTKGDVTAERVYFGYGGSAVENLGNYLANYRNPLTGELDPVTGLGGGRLIVGNPALGENPAASDQLQIQRFLTTSDNQYRLSFLGGVAGYQNVMGVYSYGVGESDPARFTYNDLLFEGVDAPGKDVVFNVPANHYFGFYLRADGGRRELNRFFTENQFNTDNRPGFAETDHVLTFQTNRGLLVTWEDLPIGGDGKMGDQDFDDMIGGLLTYYNGAPVPEPATLGLLAVGLAVVAARRRSRRLGEPKDPKNQ